MRKYAPDTTRPRPARRQRHAAAGRAARLLASRRVAVDLPEAGPAQHDLLAARLAGLRQE